jgi:low affinity Fe/Cu permease
MEINIARGMLKSLKELLLIASNHNNKIGIKAKDITSIEDIRQYIHAFALNV